MANPFKMAEQAKKVAPGNKPAPVEKKEEPVKVEVIEEQVKPEEVVTETPIVAEPVKEEEKPVKETVKKAEKKEKKAPAAEKAVDIFAGLESDKNPGKTYAFYLSDKNVEKLKAMAGKKGISASKLLDHILSEVL